MRTKEAWRARLTGLIAATMLGSITLAGVAVADDIYNDLDNTIDAAVEEMSLQADGVAGTTTLLVQPRNGDGENGCNLNQQTSATFDVVSSDTTVATVSPDKVTFTACGDKKLLTVTPLSAGHATISLTQTTNTTGGSFNVAPATFSVIVSAPVPTDTTPPVVNYVLSPATPDGDEGWYRGDVTLTWQVDDPESPHSIQKFGCVDQEITADQAEITYSCWATSDGGTADEVSVTIKRDGTAPVVNSGVTVSGTVGNNGWYTSDVTVSFTATDALSGPASATKDVTSVGEGTDVVVLSPEFKDAAGNTAAEGLSSKSFMIDLTDPTDIAFEGGPVADGSYYFGSVPDEPTCTADDEVSGLASCVVSGFGTGVGDHTLTATATDNAGRTATVTRTYTVMAWNLSGFYKPVNMGEGVVNTVKAGSTVPLKFEVFAGSELTDRSAVKSFQTSRFTCGDTSAMEDPVEVTTTGGTSLRYDDKDGQFIQNWQTPKSGSGSCYKVTMTTQDSSTIEAIFKLK